MKLIRFEPNSLQQTGGTPVPAPISLNDEVHLWILCGGVLDGFEKKREALRAVLAQYVGLSPEQIEFEELEHGKPILKPGQNPQSLHFNLSHTAGIQLIAITRLGEVGVDIERVREVHRIDSMMERFYFPVERDRVNALAGEERLREFFKIWTAKEAWAKARGVSVFRALSQYEWKADDASMTWIDLGAEFIAHLSLNSLPAN
ncbi:MAG: 4'-phosphopantetheinyl transferase family protein [Bdellovibrionia bacterium]